MSRVHKTFGRTVQGAALLFKFWTPRGQQLISYNRGDPCEGRALPRSTPNSIGHAHARPFHAQTPHIDACLLASSRARGSRGAFLARSRVRGFREGAGRGPCSGPAPARGDSSPHFRASRAGRDPTPGFAGGTQAPPTGSLRGGPGCPSCTSPLTSGLSGGPTELRVGRGVPANRGAQGCLSGLCSHWLAIAYVTGRGRGVRLRRWAETLKPAWMRSYEQVSGAGVL